MPQVIEKLPTTPGNGVVSPVVGPAAGVDNTLPVAATAAFSAVNGAALSASTNKNDSLSNSALSAHGAHALLAAAIDSWRAALDPSLDLSRLDDIELQVADLPGSALAYAQGTVITLDTDAAENAWFLDPTPADDSEFDEGSDEVAGRIDALSVLLHEVGHILGLDHDADLEVMQ